MISEDRAEKHRRRRFERPFLFNPYEMIFCGHSGAGKTTLIRRLIEGWAPKPHIGYVKHEAHRFAMDREGKDTWQAWQAGAAGVFINDSQHRAELQRGEPTDSSAPLGLQSHDIVLIEGCKNSPRDKIVVLDPERKILEALSEESLASAVAFVGSSHPSSFRFQGRPYFQRDQVDELRDFLLAYWQSKIPPLYGLVLTGGQSQRMQQDKALLRYGAQPEALRLFEELNLWTEKAFLSVHRELWRPEFQALPQIRDSFGEMGPLGGILSALRAHPHAAWLVVACDLPFLQRDTLKDLIRQREPRLLASCYRSAQNGLPEPLCAIYEPKSYARLLESVGQGIESPRRILQMSRVQEIELSDPQALENINDPEAFQRAKRLLERGHE